MATRKMGTESKKEKAVKEYTGTKREIGTSATTGLRTTVRGAVSYEEKQGKYRIRLPRAVAQDSARYISTGLSATPENLRKVMVRAWEIEEDIKRGTFDVTLERYRFNEQAVKATIAQKAKELADLHHLWQRYCEYKQPQVAVTTFKKEYLLKYANHIKALPTRDINQAAVIRDYLLSTLTPNAAKRVLTYLTACCAWAVKSELIQTNPFVDMAQEVRQPKREGNIIDPFTANERDAIIAAFTQHKTHCHYAPFVKFLFLTGCRTGEAIALQWQHINKDCSSILFCASYSYALKIRKCTKTGKARRFPCNKVLQELLLSIRPDDVMPDDLVFVSPTGKPINSTKFANQVWKGGRSGSKVYRGVVTQLVVGGAVERYRCPYTTRHTFITMALEAGLTVSQVARLVGNSPEVIYRHYAGSTVKVDVPVF